MVSISYLAGVSLSPETSHYTWQMKNKKLLAAKWVTILLIAVLTANAQEKKASSHATIVPKVSLQSQEVNQQPGNDYKVKWTAEPFDHKLFIKNAGQFNKDINTNDKVIYGAQVGRANAYFTNNGLIYKYKKLSEPKRKESKKEVEKEISGEKDQDETHYANIVWVGSNPNATIEANEKQEYDYKYPSGIASTISVSVYKKITYLNLYPGIDVEYTFPKDKDGIEYALIVHPGADLSVVKLKYNDVDSIGLNEAGEVLVKTEIGSITDHAPVCYYKDENTSVKVKYILNGSEESFKINGSYDKSKTIIVDPWTTALVFTAGYNDGYDVDYDYQGNVYVQGAWGPEQLAKYNSAGTKQWVFNETTLNNGSSQPCYGDFAVNRNNGECYCVEGDREITTGAEILKINTNGVLMTTFPGNVNYQEMWRVAYNSCTNDLVIAGGGTNANNQAATLDTALTTIILRNSLAATCAYHDMVLLALDPNGSSCYMASSESCDFACTQASADDRLLKMPLPSLTPNTFNVSAPSVGSFPEDIQDVNYMTWSGVPTNGFNGAACSTNFLYMYDGASVWQINKASGGVTKTKAIAGGSQQSWGGLDVDGCDNSIYVGFKNTVQVYNSSLGLTSTLAATNTVYDIMLGQNYKTLYVTGHGFVQAITTGSSAVTTIKVTNPATCGSCNGTARADLSLCSTIDTTGATYLWSNGATTHTITGLCAGTYKVTITPPGNCQTKYIDSVTVAIGGGLTVTANAAPPSYCTGGSTTLTAGGATTYTWSPGTGLSATTGSSVTANPGSSITYTVTGTTGGCIGTQTVVVTVTAPPTVNANAVSPTICAGNSTNITATGATTYAWSPGTGLSATTGATVSATPGSTITYTVTGTTGGCIGTATVAITVNPSPTITATPVTPSVCPGGSTVINAGGGTTYTWSPGTGLSATTGASVTATPGSTITYTVTGTTAGCNGTATVVITVNPAPVITLTPSTSICPGGNITLTAGGASTYTWSPGASLSATTGASVTATPGGTTTYTVTGTSAAGCTGTKTVVITVIPSLTVTVSPSSPSICLGANTTLTAGGATTYTWSPGTGLSATTGTSVTASPGGTITYTVTGKSGGCSGKDSVTVTINPTPTVSINITGISAAICGGDTIGLYASGAVTYKWTPSTGLNATTGSHVIAGPGTTTTYTVTGTNASGCTNTASIVVTIYPTPTVSILPSAPGICPGDSVALKASGATTYTWVPSTYLSCTACPNPVSTPTATITYTVVGKGAGGCTSTDSVTITVAPKLNVTITPSSSSICTGDSVVLNANGASNYTWSPPGGLSCSSCSNTSAYPGSTITYTVTGTSSGCVGKDSITITVNPTPTVSIAITGISPAICPGDTVGMIASGAGTYTWSPSTGLNVTTGTHVVASPTVTITYTVTGVNGSGCNSTATQVITVYPTPTVALSAVPSSTICSGTTTTINATGASNYTWSPISSLSASTGASVIAGPNTTTTYTVVGASGTGCRDTAQPSVTVHT